uniref:Family with sequence similarity 234 member B n=1 Tax=Pelodiscus sinensis TaxID=13735 RepID=K7FRP2_PELSI|nr:protein FAM234B isoform X1 [Pelodiscus sinensis]|eukprot:XP_006110470.1 protein FAM234B isoform X1 [Pelodiscus sinensis]
MATVLSRALKLPGKKSPDLGEYDPLTQADSDESEDDLVLNLQKNGGVKNGKSALEEVQDPDSDVEVEVTKQRLSESAPDGYPAEATGSLEHKAASSLMPYLRTAVFLLTMVISMILVLVCAFLIPCPPRDLHNTWNRNLGQEAGGLLFPLELSDVNGDGLPDILLSFTGLMNASVLGVSRPSVTVMALSGMNGSTLWSSHIPEEIRSVQCKGLTLAAPAEPVCLVTGTSKFLSLLHASSGKTIWTLNPAHLPSGTLAAPAVLLPDLDGDKVGDLVVLAIGETQPDLCFILVSGMTGKPLGGPVKYSINGEGKLIGPQAHTTSRGAIYILFGFGNVQAVALRDIFAQARNRDSFPPILQQEESEWEKRRSVNLSELIDIYSGGVEFLQIVTASDTNCSDLLITTKHSLTLLRGEDLKPRWNLEQQDIHTQPAPGYFSADQTLDFMVQAQSRDNLKKMLVVDGKSGLSIWSYDLPCHLQESDVLSVMTLERKSVFLFWADEMQPELQNLEPGLRIKRPGLHHLYLLHPAFPTLLLDLTNVTDTVIASAIGINDLQKDAFYITMTTSSTSENQLGLLVVSKLGLRWAMLTQSRMVPLIETTPKISRGEVRRFLSRLKFVDFPHKF